VGKAAIIFPLKNYSAHRLCITTRCKNSPGMRREARTFLYPASAAIAINAHG